MTTTPTLTLVLICCYVHISTPRYYHHILSLDNILFGNNPPYKWDYYSSKLRQYCLFGDHILEICVNPYNISNTLANTYIKYIIHLGMICRMYPIIENAVIVQ